MKSFFFKGVISIFIVLRGPSHALAACPLLAALLGQAAPPRAIYLSLLLSFTIHNNLAQAQQLSNRKYAEFKRTEVPRPYQQKVTISTRAAQKNTKRTVSSARPSINISKIAKTTDNKNDIENKTTKSEKKEK